MSSTPALEGTERHAHARAVLGAALAPGAAPSHAYLFCGPAGAGKRTVARAFASELLADGAADPSSVRGRVQRGVHPDLTWVVPSGAHELLTGDIAEPVVAAAPHTPFEAQRRVFVIERADTMNEEAANRLLKTLEEPPAHAHLLLLTERPGEVKPTIASRCQAVRFEPPTVEAIVELLRGDGVDASSAGACARLALGDLHRARRLARADGVELRSAAERFARAPLAGTVAQRPWTGLLDCAKRSGEPAITNLEEKHSEAIELTAKRDRRRLESEHAERVRRARRRAQTETLDLGLALVALWYRDLACLAFGAAELVAHADRTEQLKSDAAARDGHPAVEAAELVEETRRRLAVNVSEELACEALAYRLEELLARPAQGSR